MKAFNLPKAQLLDRFAPPTPTTHQGRPLSAEQTQYNMTQEGKMLLENVHPQRAGRMAHIDDPAASHFTSKAYSNLAHDFLPLMPEQYLFIKAASENGYDSHEVAAKLIQVFGSVFVGKPMKMIKDTVEKVLSLTDEQVKDYSWAKKIKPRASPSPTPSTQYNMPTNIFVTAPPVEEASSPKLYEQSAFTAPLAVKTPPQTQGFVPYTQRQQPHGQQSTRSSFPKQHPHEAGTSARAQDHAHAHAQAQAQVQAQAYLNQPKAQTDHHQAILSNADNLHLSGRASGRGRASTMVSAPLQTASSSFKMPAHLPANPVDFVTITARSYMPIDMIISAVVENYPSFLHGVNEAKIRAIVTAQVEAVERQMEL